MMPGLLQSRQYSGTVATLLYNWPIFAGLLMFGAVGATVAAFLETPWSYLLFTAGIAAFSFAVVVIVAAFCVYDYGRQREYDRLFELGQLSTANVVIDVTAGKLRGTRGLLSRVKQGHYFIVDIFDPDKMPDQALRRARAMEPPLESDRRVYRRSAQPNQLPIPHNWADAIYCSFSLHELQKSADRDAIFAEFSRILKPGGRLLIAEHGRDWRNLLVFGPGVFSFYSAACWEQHISAAGLHLKHHERWRGLVQLWVAEKRSR
jgi:ubiquinone/menaquinone biosynthesis C-methylase UbiE